ncbi:MAG: single-stranded-DNA-specific exonuclease RecJ [Clostridia bacterium]|nr:single-stranded-DNA-specific exonuclease RecJ [Clostridia bacterium]
MPLALKPQKRISEIDFHAVEALAAELQVSRLFAQILWNRGLTTAQAAQAVLCPCAEHDPFTMKNMRTLVDRLDALRARNGRVTVYGDYDVDGVCAVAILCEALKRYGITASHYIPDRHREGYGLNDGALETVFASGCDLLITVDCGIASADLIAKHTKKGRAIVVTDHHLIGERLPDCPVVKPGQPGDTYETPDLCGAGIAYKIAQALLGENARDLVDLACVATVADVVPLTGENRTIVQQGLEKLKRGDRPCLEALLGEQHPPVTVQSIGFMIAPRLNAAGRMDSPEKALALLTAPEEDIPVLVKELNDLNTRRQAAEKRMLEDAEEQLRQNGFLRRDKVILLGGTDWEDGVIGICAARLAEKYHRPCLLFAVSPDGHAKGSGRSVEGVDLFTALKSTEDIWEQFGGHTMAAGMSMDWSLADQARRRLSDHLIASYDERVFYPCAVYDAKACVADISLDFCRELERLQPCGCGCPEVVLRVDRCQLGGFRLMGEDKRHLKMNVQDDSGRAEAVAFSFEKHGCDYFHLNRASVILKPAVNVWLGKESVSLQIQAVKPSENIQPRRNAEEATALFFSRLAYPRTGRAKVETVDDPEDMMFRIAQWAQEDVCGTLILCDHPEYAAGCIARLEEEAPRFDTAYGLPPEGHCGYNALVVAAKAESIDLTPFSRVVFYDLINSGYADMLAERAPHLTFYALACDAKELFSSLFEEYRQGSRTHMMNAYRAIAENEGVFADLAEFLRAVAEKKQLSMPLLAMALPVFEELGFFTVTRERTRFGVKLNRAGVKRALEESKLYRTWLALGGQG